MPVLSSRQASRILASNEQRPTCINKKIEVTNEIVNELEETKSPAHLKTFDIEKHSKLIVDPRMLDPSIEDDYGSENYQPNYTPVIDLSLFPKVKAKSYLRILELTKW